MLCCHRHRHHRHHHHLDTSTFFISNSFSPFLHLFSPGHFFSIFFILARRYRGGKQHRAQGREQGRDRDPHSAQSAHWTMRIEDAA